MDRSDVAILIDHLESRLGHMSGGWDSGQRSAEAAPRVCHFRGGSLGDVDSFATVGLHQTPLLSRTTGRHLHVELLGSSHPQPGGSGPWPDVLDHVSQEIRRSGAAVLRGDIVQLPSPLGPSGTMTALYAAIPVYLDDAFGSVRLENGVDVAIVWLVPVGDTEAEFVRHKGWKAFEDALVRLDPDLLDLNRRELPL